MILYLAAPVSAPDAAGVEANLARARRWLRFFVNSTPHAICAPWIPYVEALDESDPEHRRRGLQDDIAILRRCDAIVLVGGRVSDGMQIERTAAHGGGLRIVNLTSFGDEPPTGLAALEAIARLAKELS